MPASENATCALATTSALLTADADARSIPVWLTRDPGWVKDAALTDAQKAWIHAQSLKGSARKHVLVPDADGGIAGVVLWLGEARTGDPMDRPELAIGALPAAVPPGRYRLASALEDAELAAVAWGLGAYRFRRYKSGGGSEDIAALEFPSGADVGRTQAIVEAIGTGRDLINTPASDLGPEELEAAARRLAERHGTTFTCTVGADLLAANFPMIHAVGRASERAPRLIDMAWGRADAARVTLVGKGICFDTGGLDIKPASGMLIMKKDMGGAATALALGHMIMSAKLDVRLRILIPAAENSISGNAFRPGDILKSRAGKTVEIGNTDAEGRLVLADALTLADEDKPDTLLSFATLTGAARVALGPDLPPFFSDDDAFAQALLAAGLRVGDPVWRMPFWSGYEANLDSPVADMNNVSDGPFAGAVTAALFLRRFVRQARRYGHFDIYGWRPAPRPLGPKGGEVQAARAVFDMLCAQAKAGKP
ncbi:MAG TPA: leucyl aminopeptidase family protein [Hyphomicrobiaceae bacterium]|nr:leucyl aminopeptidase family protein [Hyphomicrobiaceae bacterium]